MKTNTPRPKAAGVAARPQAVLEQEALEAEAAEAAAGDLIGLEADERDAHSGLLYGRKWHFRVSFFYVFTLKF